MKKSFKNEVLQENPDRVTLGKRFVGFKMPEIGITGCFY